MKQPIIFSVDDDPQVLQAINRDLRSQYRQKYRIMATDSAQEALEALQALKNKGEQVALLLSDQRMPQMQGIDFLEQAKRLYPEAKRVLLTAYSDTDAAIKAINDVQLDYYLLKPWDPPEEKLYPVLQDLLDDWEAQYIPELSGVKVVGYQFSPQSHKLKDFLHANLFPYHWLDYETQPDAQALIQSNGIAPQELPVIFFEDGTFLRNPALPQVAQQIGLKPDASAAVYDVAIIGAGPAGLAAAVYGASEGLQTLLIDRRAPGGQAGTSSRIENYLGFPTGLSGADLARRAITQATRFGAEFLSPRQVVSIQRHENLKQITFDDGQQLYTKSIVIATGVDYRQLDTPGIAQFTGAGIYYGAATTEAASCKNSEVYVVGGGNSAGQAAMYLSKFAQRVHILIRREDLSSTMSSYLIDQINNTENIQVLPFTEITKAEGKEQLETLILYNHQTNTNQQVVAKALFIFIGAKPYTDWLGEEVLKDTKGFVYTGRDLLLHAGFKKLWKHPRDPYLLETSTPGIFAAGDVRSGAMNRVASAVGEGSMAISFVHKYLTEI
ncbi:response regulator [Eisenibacter elegans]|uniref:response regulator n=1 Tax=Eisenibacter elegans TaxID=997 RepID=UPI000416935D|nr:response regulator [Eisenibacter elegans]